MYRLLPPRQFGQTSHPPQDEQRLERERRLIEQAQDPRNSRRSRLDAIKAMLHQNFAIGPSWQSITSVKYRYGIGHIPIAQWLVEEPYLITHPQLQAVLSLEHIVDATKYLCGRNHPSRSLWLQALRKRLPAPASEGCAADATLLLIKPEMSHEELALIEPKGEHARVYLFSQLLKKPEHYLQAVNYLCDRKGNSLELDMCLLTPPPSEAIGQKIWTYLNKQFKRNSLSQKIRMTAQALEATGPQNWGVQWAKNLSQKGLMDRHLHNLGERYPDERTIPVFFCERDLLSFDSRERFLRMISASESKNWLEAVVRSAMKTDPGVAEQALLRLDSEQIRVRLGWPRANQTLKYWLDNSIGHLPDENFLRIIDAITNNHRQNIDVHSYLERLPDSRQVIQFALDKMLQPNIFMQLCYARVLACHHDAAATIDPQLAEQAKQSIQQYFKRESRFIQFLNASQREQALACLARVDRSAAVQQWLNILQKEWPRLDTLKILIEFSNHCNPMESYILAKTLEEQLAPRLLDRMRDENWTNGALLLREINQEILKAKNPEILTLIIDLASRLCESTKTHAVISALSAVGAAHARLLDLHDRFPDLRKLYLGILSKILDRFGNELDNIKIKTKITEAMFDSLHGDIREKGAEFYLRDNAPTTPWDVLKIRATLKQAEGTVPRQDELIAGFSGLWAKINFRDQTQRNYCDIMILREQAEDSDLISSSKFFSEFEQRIRTLYNPSLATDPIWTINPSAQRHALITLSSIRTLLEEQMQHDPTSAVLNLSILIGQFAKCGSAQAEAIQSVYHHLSTQMPQGAFDVVLNSLIQEAKEQAVAEMLQRRAHSTAHLRELIAPVVGLTQVLGFREALLVADPKDRPHAVTWFFSMFTPKFVVDEIWARCETNADRKLLAQRDSQRNDPELQAQLGAARRARPLTWGLFLESGHAPENLFSEGVAKEWGLELDAESGEIQINRDFAVRLLQATQFLTTAH